MVGGYTNITSSTNPCAIKTTGLDGLSYESFKANKLVLLPVIDSFEEFVSTTGLMPSRFRYTPIYMLGKRPIYIPSVLIRIVCKVILQRVMITEDKISSLGQMAYLSNPNPYIGIEIIEEVLIAFGYHKDQFKTNAALGIINFSRPFDRLSHRYLRVLLSNMEFFKPTLKYLLATFENYRGQEYNDKRLTSVAANMTSGFRLGNPLSPFILGLAFEPLLTKIRSQINGITESQFRVAIIGNNLILGLRDMDDHGKVRSEIAGFEKVATMILDVPQSKLVYGTSAVPSPWGYLIQRADQPLEYAGMVFVVK